VLWLGCCAGTKIAFVSASISTEELGRLLGGELRRGVALTWRIEGVRGGAAAYCLAKMLSDRNGPVLLVAPTSAAAEEIVEDLRTVLGETDARDFLTRRIHAFPERDVPPFEMVSPSLETEAARAAALYQLARGRAPIVVTSVAALSQRTPAPETLLESARYMTGEDELDIDSLVQDLERFGYRRTGVVEEPAEFAVRGGIVDVWPAGADYPCRIELYGDSIESLRHFEPSDQRSFGAAEDLLILAANAVPVERLGETAVRRAVHARCDELNLRASVRRELDEGLSAGIRFPGVELVTSYAGKTPGWLGDYHAAGTPVVLIDQPAIAEALADQYALLAEAETTALEASSFFPERERLFVDATAIQGLLAREPRIEIDRTECVESANDGAERTWRVEVHTNEGLSAVRARVRATRGEHHFQPMELELERMQDAGTRLVVLASDATQLERLAHLLELSGRLQVARADSFPAALTGMPTRIWLVRGRLERGFRVPADGLAVVTDEEIFGERRRVPRRRAVSKSRALAALAELEPGDHMVHADHGIGVYRGLQRLTAGGLEGDFIHLEYAGGDRYFLPVTRINLVQKYTGSGAGAPALSRLGGNAWTRTKGRARDAIMEMARELLEVEAYRAVHTRDVFAESGPDFEEFEAHFPFEETDGQKTAIRDVVGDLSGAKPMDRLVCGDVGYGKTEVALRAAYLAAMGGKQVAFLVPTTVLARQHFDTLRGRFEGYPLHCAMLSRFNTREENARVVAGLAAGTIDIVVGTHRLLQKDVQFGRLGLLVIDEEHRFGVAAKEKIKKLRRQIDVLTLTATPIPRTLQLALTGVRDLSLIETPPVDRLAIRTYVARHDDGLIKQAVDREVARAGQVFYVHNRVATIAAAALRLTELSPKARIAVAHGQMDEGELERVMLAFLAHESDVLVCTSIIESGLDIPNANTIVVERADTFGLAQLYQIRGRVGRSHRRAFAYLLVPHDRIVTDEARRRLEVLRELDDLGSGFRVAAHDMEIRGAGNLLGRQQSGHVAAVGFDLFMQMMEEASRELRGETSGPTVEPEIEVGVEAFIPDDYVPDIGERLLMYKRLANADSQGALDTLAEEIADRFGARPPPVENFLRVMAIRPALKRLAVESLKANEGAVALRFHPDAPVDRERLVAFATRNPERYRLRPGGVFALSLPAAGWEEMLEHVRGFLGELERGTVPRAAARLSQKGDA
jgi:transcription-repair coupling factor (superfamily II helicase)